ncbi:MAG: hypothetical protein GY805_06125 [Chloroflexi bacterium]|nr:hypothetical protein [Chloroflexota bacterium]
MNIQTQLKCQTCFAPLNVAQQTSRIMTCSYCGAENVVPQKIQTITRVNAHRFSTILYKYIADEFDLAEVQDLIIRFNGQLPHSKLDFEELQGHTKSAKARSLVSWCRRRDLLDKLTRAVQSTRPTANFVL